MKILKIKMNCPRSRWICSAVCTIFFISLFFIIPFWNFSCGMNSTPELSKENSVSIVSVTKKKKSAPVQKIEKKVSAPKENVIAKKPILEQAVEEKREYIEESMEENVSESVPAEDLQPGMENTETSGESVSGENNSEEPSLLDSEKKALASYKSYALARIASKKTYPYSARSQHLEGKVRVRVVINPDGSVVAMELLEKCEHEVLNEACLEAIKKAAPFKKMPEGQDAMTLTFVMDYSLKEKSR